MSLGLFAGALQCYLNWCNVDRDISPLCTVLDEEVTVFGTGINRNGGDSTGTFIREVDMSGFGYVLLSAYCYFPSQLFLVRRDSKWQLIHLTTPTSKTAVYLYIVPTLTFNALPLSSILTNTVYNITDCTYNISTSYTQATTDADSGTVFPLFQLTFMVTRIHVL